MVLFLSYLRRRIITSRRHERHINVSIKRHLISCGSVLVAFTRFSTVALRHHWRCQLAASHTVALKCARQLGGDGVGVGGRRRGKERRRREEGCL